MGGARRGFTLIELTVGLVTASLALSLGYSAYGVLLAHRESVEAAGEADLRAAAIRSALAGWMRGIQSEAQPGGPLLSGLDDETNGLPTDQLSLFTSAVDGRSDRAMLRLFIESDAASLTRGLVAEWSYAGAVAPVRTLLAADVAGLDVRYWSGILGAHRWLPSWISTSVLPAGVEIQLIAAAGVELHPLLALPLRVAIEAGR